jgi:hypothetical protein
MTPATRSRLSGPEALRDIDENIVEIAGGVVKVNHVNILKRSELLLLM